MDAHEEGIGLPAAQFLDRHGCDAIDVHGHGSSSSEGVATDVARSVAQSAEAKVISRSFDGSVDVRWCHL